MEKNVFGRQLYYILHTKYKVGTQSSIFKSILNKKENKRQTQIYLNFKVFIFNCMFQCSHLWNAVGIVEAFSELTKFCRFDKVCDIFIDFVDFVVTFVEKIIVFVVVAAQVVAWVRFFLIDFRIRRNFEDVDDVDLFVQVIVVRLNVKLNLKKKYSK